jgi:DNA-directed RNA polymerase subunit RPC12/RpoP
MHTIQKQTVRCPNCGSEAERHYFVSEDVAYAPCPSHHVIQTECPACDYLMVMCSRNGNVVEAYAPGTKSATHSSLTPFQGIELLTS